MNQFKKSSYNFLHTIAPPITRKRVAAAQIALKISRFLPQKPYLQLRLSDLFLKDRLKAAILLIFFYIAQEAINSWKWRQHWIFKTHLYNSRQSGFDSALKRTIGAFCALAKIRFVQNINTHFENGRTPFNQFSLSKLDLTLELCSCASYQS